MSFDRRKRGSYVWCFRWREAGPDGRRIHRRIVLGTADELKSIASARKMVVELRREININDGRMRKESITRTTCRVTISSENLSAAVSASRIRRKESMQAT